MSYMAPVVSLSLLHKRKLQLRYNLLTPFIVEGVFYSFMQFIKGDVWYNNQEKGACYE